MRSLAICIELKSAPPERHRVIPLLWFPHSAFLIKPNGPSSLSDHLSDRELYQELWERGLRNPPICPGEIPAEDGFTISWGSWGEEEMCLWLRYYASDDERAKHLQEWPKDTLPPK
ncbi:MAG: hypothetical protein JWM16_2640, partial [Verrucomicrobiales bacterium]|nr:hypothetical protein [Verrucomicrobiales bacterium]